MAFSMDTANPEQIKIKVAEDFIPSEKVKKELANLTGINTESIKNLDMSSLTERHDIVKAIENFGTDVMNKSAGQNTVLQSKFMGVNSIWGESSSIVAGLLSLRSEMKKLSPDDIDLGPSGLIGKLFNPVKAYFDKYSKADESINNIIQTLDKGKSVLKNDNITLEIEKQSLRKLTSELSKEIEFGVQMDESITKILDNASINNFDEEKIRFISEEILYPLKQRLFDLNQLLIVNQQGIVSVEILIKNNRELIRGIDRARTVTLTALRTAVLVASSLYNQKIILKKVQSLGGLTDSMILGTSGLLKQQGTLIGQSAAASGNASIETLKTAFEETFEALDTISCYKAQAMEGIEDALNKFSALKNTGI